MSARTHEIQFPFQPCNTAIYEWCFWSVFVFYILHGITYII